MPGYKFSGPNGTFDSYLLLEDGSIFLGKHFGADICIDGEVGKLSNKPDTWFSIREETDPGTWIMFSESSASKCKFRRCSSAFQRFLNIALTYRECNAV